MKSKAIFGLFAFAVVAFGFAAISAQPALAKKDEVTICHARSSRSNPYGPKALTVDANSIFKDGHDGHTGSIFDPNNPAQKSWGDIIPSFTYVEKGETKTYPGLNLPEGQAWLDNNCQQPGTPVVDICDTTQIKGSVAEWLAENEFDGSDCFGRTIEKACGFLDVKITKQPEPGYASQFVAVYTTNGQVAFPVSDFPAVFAEDFNGGSVDVTWFTVGPEGDWLSQSTFPNFWNKTSGETITVDTDCKDEPGRGGETPKTPETPTKPETPVTPASNEVAELPNTAGSMTAVIATSAVSILGLLAAVGTAIKSRLLA